MIALGSNVNILPNKMWEAMGKPMLVYSPIQMCMENQYCIYPVGRLENVEVDLVGVNIVADFEVIEIMGDKDPYVDFNLVQYFTANRFSVKEQKRYNGKYTHYTDIFPLETQTGKTNIFYIHS
jgi:hypothetical protein